MSSSLSRLRVAAMAVGALLLQACGDSSSAVRDISGPDLGTGTLIVRLDTPNPDDGAVRILLRGNGVDGVHSANEEHYLFIRESDAVGGTGVFHLALVGDGVSGALLTFRVPDVQRVAEYSVELVEVADNDGRLRSSLAGYGLRVVR